MFNIVGLVVSMIIEEGLRECLKSDNFHFDIFLHGFLFKKVVPFVYLIYPSLP